MTSKLVINDLISPKRISGKEVSTTSLLKTPGKSDGKENNDSNTEKSSVTPPNEMIKKKQSNLNDDILDINPALRSFKDGSVI